MSNLEIKRPKISEKEVLSDELKIIKSLESELKLAKSNMDKIQVYKKFLKEKTLFASKIGRLELRSNVELNVDDATNKLLQELDQAFEEHKVNPRLDFALKDNVVVHEENEVVEVKQISKSIRFGRNVVIQNKELVLKNLQDINPDLLEHTLKDIEKLSNKKKIEILECFGDQTLATGLSTVISHYKSNLIEGTPPKDTNVVLRKLLSLMNNYRVTDLKLDSVLDGGLARVGSKRGLDLKKNLDLNLGGMAELNDDVWETTKEFVGKGLDKFKDAPNGVKGFVLVAGAFTAMFGYSMLTAEPVEGSSKKEFILPKVLKYALYAVGGYAAVNAIMDINEKAMPRDYEKLGNIVKAKDYAEFLLSREPEDNEVTYAEAFIESMYNPRVYNLEFSETINLVKNKQSDSVDWVNYVDGKGVDAENTYGGIKMFIDRYDPSSKSKSSIYKSKEVPIEVQNEMKEIWGKVSEDQNRGNELSYRDVVLRFLAIDPEFTFENDRYKGNERIETEEAYQEKQGRIKELERMYWFDSATMWVEEKTSNETLTSFLSSLPFSDEFKSIMPDFVSIFHRSQGEISDMFVNVDEISSVNELRKYKAMTREQNFNIMKKRVSFKGSDLKLEKGSVITMESKMDSIYTSLYTSTIAVPSREEFFNNFTVIDQANGKELSIDSPDLEFKTLSSNGEKSSPEMILLPEKTKLVAKNNVQLEDYVLYGKDIRFQ